MSTDAECFAEFGAHGVPYETAGAASETDDLAEAFRMTPGGTYLESL